MKRKIILLSIIIILIIFLSGSEISLDYIIKTYIISGDLDKYLIQKESRFKDIVPGTEKKIFWADPKKKDKTEYSIIYLHGFSATRRETAPLSNMLAKKLQANLFYTRLTGHGRDGSALAEATVNNWLNDTIEAVTIGRLLGKRIIVIGTSTGATLATWLADYDRREDIAAFILISPNFGPKNPASEILNWPWAEYFVPLFLGKNISWESDNEKQMKYWTTSYPTISLLPMMGLIRLVTESDLNSISQPFLFIFSPEDKIVDPKKTEEIYGTLGSGNKQKYYVIKTGDPNNHVIAGDILSPENNDLIVQVIFEFVEKF